MGWPEGKHVGAGTDIQEQKMVRSDEKIENRKEVEKACSRSLVGALMKACKPQRTEIL